MNDGAAQAGKITAEFADLRADHLKALDGLECLVRELAPLPISYDVTRLQPPFFSEFTYTELLGGIYVAPQSTEIAARLAAAALDTPGGDFDVVGAIMSRPHMDKYKLDEATQDHRRVAFVAGSNIFGRAVCKEALSRAMHDDPELVIKPHPLTGEETIRTMGRLYGYHRLLEPMASGWECLAAADEILTLSTSEMGLYAILLGKPTRNLTKYAYEARAAYGPLYRLLWGQSPTEARNRLVRLLSSALGGFLHPADPEAEAKARTYFATAMQIREPFRPLMPDFEDPEYAAFLLHGANKPQGT